MFKKFYTKVIKGICFIIAKVIYKTEVEGIEKIPEGEGVIICGNHVHGLDAPLLMALYPKKTICFMAKQELFKNKFLKFLGGLYNVFPVNRDINDTEAVRKALSVLLPTNRQNERGISAPFHIYFFGIVNPKIRLLVITVTGTSLCNLNGYFCFSALISLVSLASITRTQTIGVTSNVTYLIFSLILKYPFFGVMG